LADIADTDHADAKDSSWPTRADEWSRLVAGNLTFMGTQKRDSRAAQEGRLVAGSGFSLSSPQADFAGPGHRIGSQLPGSAANSL
jgi:hypothetical protein